MTKRKKKVIITTSIIGGILATIQILFIVFIIITIVAYKHDKEHQWDELYEIESEVDYKVTAISEEGMTVNGNNFSFKYLSNSVKKKNISEVIITEDYTYFLYGPDHLDRKNMSHFDTVLYRVSNYDGSYEAIYSFENVKVYPNATHLIELYHVISDTYIAIHFNENLFVYNTELKQVTESYVVCSTNPTHAELCFYYDNSFYSAVLNKSYIWEKDHYTEVEPFSPEYKDNQKKYILVNGEEFQYEVMGYDDIELKDKDNNTRQFIINPESSEAGLQARKQLKRGGAGASFALFSCGDKLFMCESWNGSYGYSTPTIIFEVDINTGDLKYVGYAYDNAVIAVHINR